MDGISFAGPIAESHSRSDEELIDPLRLSHFLMKLIDLG